jgi:DNA-binding transcriptional MerR regulator
MKPSDVSSRVGISAVTVRTWSNQFARFMSPTGAGGDGRHRDFSEVDIRVMQYIKTEKARGQSGEEITQSLHLLQDNGGLDDLPLPDENHHSDVPMLPVAAAEEARKLLLAQIATLENRAGALERQLMAEQAGRRNDTERMLREMGTLQSDLAEAKTLLKLYRKRNRIEGDDD